MLQIVKPGEPLERSS